MIQIQLNNDKNDYIDTNEGINIPLEFNNPMFANVKDLFKSFTYSFNLPKTPKNSKLLDYPTYINNVQEWRTRTANIYKSGILIATGDLIIRSATENSISINVQISKKIDWFNVRKMTELKELGYVWQNLSPNWYCDVSLFAYVASGGTGISALEQLTIEITGKVYAANFVIAQPSLLVDFFSTLSNLAAQINADTTNNNAIATMYPYNITGVKCKIQRVDTSKDFYVLPTARKIETESYVFEYTVVDNVGFDNLTKAYIDNVVANENDYIFHYGTQWLLVGDDNNTKVEMNHFINGFYDFISDNISITSPQIFCKKGLELILKTFGYELEAGGFFDEPNFERLFFANNQSNAPTRIDGNTLDEDWFRAFPEYFFFYKDKFPDSTLADWLQDLANLFCLFVDIDNKAKKIRIKSLNEVITSAVAVEYETPPTYQIDRQEAYQGFTFKMPKPNYKDSYKPIFEQFNLRAYLDLKIGDGKTEIKTNITFPDLVYDNNGVDAGFSLPSYFGGWWSALPNYEKIPFFKPADAETISFGQRGNAKKANGLAFYLGFINGKPRSYWSYGFDTLFWGVDNPNSQIGLYNKRWRIYTDFLTNAKLVKRKIYLSTVQLSQLDLSKKIRIDNQNYFIKKLRTSLTHQQTNKIVCDVELWTV